MGDECFFNREPCLGVLEGHQPLSEPQMLLQGVGTVIALTFEDKIMQRLDEKTYKPQHRAWHIVGAQYICFLSPIQKMGRRSKYTVLQRGHTHGQQAREKMSHMANYKRNTNQNYIEVSPQTSHNGHL